MKRRILVKSIEDIYKMREKISFPDYQREPKLWRIKDKQLLIDSILNDIDVPKLYFYEEKKGEYEVIDGQQRLWAIWQFIDNDYDYENRKFNKLDRSQKNKILSYKLQITIITETSDEHLRKLFLRLQLGLLLNTGEKLNAMDGVMKDFVFGKMVLHPFIADLVKIPDRRYAKQTLCAQICINSFSRKKINDFSRTRFEDLSNFFKEYVKLEGKELSFFNERCKLIKEVLDKLNECFKGKNVPLKNRSLILSIYLFVEELQEEYETKEIKNTLPKFVAFMQLFLKRLKEEVRAGMDRKNKELYYFESYLSNAPGEKYQIENRHRKIKEFFEYYQNTKKIKGDRQ